MGTGANLKVGASNAEFNKAMKSMVQDMKTVKSEFTLASTQAKLFGTATDQLKAKQVELSSKLSIQNNMLKNQESQLKTLAQNTDNLKAKKAELTAKIAEATNKYKEAVTATGKDSEASKSLKTELDNLSEAYAKLDKHIDSNNSKMDTSIQKINTTKTNILENTKALEDTNSKLKTSNWDEFGNKMNKVSSKSGELANKLQPASGAIAGIGMASATASVQFEDSMAKVSTISDESEVSLNDMKKAILDLSSQTGISANEIADNVYEAISSGQKTGDAVAFVSNATKLAKSGFADSASSLDILTTTLNAYGLKSSEVGSVSDKLITTQNLGKVSVDDLAQSMGKLIPTAKNSGVNLDNITSAYALMTNGGIKSAETTTYVNSMINELSKNGTKASNNLKKLSGSSFQELMASGKSLGDVLAILQKGADESGLSMQDMFGSTEAGNAGLAISANAGKDFNDVLGQMKNSAGATDTAFKKMDSTTGSSLKKSFNDLKNSGIKMGDALAPVLSSVSDGIKGFTGWLSSLSEEQLKNIANMAGMVLGVTGVLMAISGITGAIGGFVDFVGNIKKIKKLMTEWGIITKIQTGLQWLLNVAMSANPIALIVIAIVAVIAIIVVLYNKCEWFRNGINAIGSWILNFFKVTLPNAFVSVVAWFKSLPEKAGKLWEIIKTAFSNGWNAIVNFFMVTIPAWIESIVGWFNTLPEKIGIAIGFVLGTIIKWGINVWNYLSTNVPIWINNIVNFFATLPQRIWDWLVKIVTSIVTWGANMLTKAKEGMSKVKDGVIDAFTNLPDKMLETGKNIIKGIWNGISGTATWLKDKITGFASGIVEGFNQALDIHSPARVMNPTGKFIVQGVGVGIENETPNLEADINSSIATLTTKLRSTVDINANANNIKNTKANETNKIYDKILEKMDAIAKAVDMKIDAQSIVDKTVEPMSEALAFKSGREIFV